MTIEKLVIMVEICLISLFQVQIAVHHASLVSMSLKSFPIIFINMGGEMVYILDQRLSAQNIDNQKAVKGNDRADR